MNGKNMNFDDKKILKSDFYKNKKVFQIDDIDVDQIFFYTKQKYLKKKKKKKKKALIYFIGYNDNGVIRPLCLRLSKMTGYTRKFKENTTMSLSINND